jgi:hypothetical protein
MIRIEVKLLDQKEAISISEGGRLNANALRNLFVEMHMRRGDDEAEPIRYRGPEGDAGEINPALIAELRMFRDDEDITDEIIIAGE